MKTQLLKLALILIFSLVGTVNSAIAQQICSSDIIQTAPTERFSVNGDGTVTDRQTGLMWAQCLQGLSGSNCDTGTQESFNWAFALPETQATSDTQNRADWRLPNVKELATLAELACVNPAINMTVFPGLTAPQVWSASPSIAIANTAAWVIDFSDGRIRIDLRDNERSVRLVRGGQ